MAAPAVDGTPFKGKIGFFDRLGWFDVIIPFIICFALIYWFLSSLAIFEKSKLKIVFRLIASLGGSILIVTIINLMSRINEYYADRMMISFLVILLVADIMITLKKRVSDDVFGLIIGIAGLIAVFFSYIRNLFLGEILILLISIFGIIYSVNGLKKNKGIAIAGLVINIIVLLSLVIFRMLLLMGNV